MRAKVLFEDCKPLVVFYEAIACLYCFREWSRDGQGYGFRKAGAYRHRFACFEKTLAKRGWRIGNWSNNRMGYRLVKLPPVSSRSES